MDIERVFKEVFSLVKQRFGAFLFIGLPYALFSLWFIPYSGKPFIEFNSVATENYLMVNLALLILGWLFNVFMYVVVAVKCHRVFLHNSSFEMKDYFIFKKHHFVFLLATLKIGMLYMVLMFPYFALWDELSIENDLLYDLEDLLLLIMLLIAGFFCAQFSLILPASAVGHKLSMADSLRLTKGKRYIVFMLFAAVPTATTFGLSYLYLLEFEVIQYIEISLMFLVGLIELGLLSVCYRYLVEKPAGELATI